MQYHSAESKNYRIVFSLFAIICIVTMIFISRRFGNRISLPEINSGISGGMIFIVGLLSGLHCVGMCGSFLISYACQAAENGQNSIYHHISYGAGKTLSYALLGALFGLVGSIFRITSLISGISISAAGAFLIIYGLKMMNIFGLGTLPALSGFGFLAGRLSSGMTRNFIRASGIILIVLGSIMLNKGFLRALPGPGPQQQACECCKPGDQPSGKTLK